MLAGQTGRCLVIPERPSRSGTNPVAVFSGCFESFQVGKGLSARFFKGVPRKKGLVTRDGDIGKSQETGQDVVIDILLPVIPKDEPLFILANIEADGSDFSAFRASTSATESISPPRVALTSTAVGFIRPRASRSMVGLVSGCMGSCRLTMSDSASRLPGGGSSIPRDRHA